MSQYLEVVFPLHLTNSFTYEVPEDLTGEILVGHRVLVPFKHRTMTGYVVNRHAQKPEAFSVKPVQAVLDDIPLLTPSLMAIAKNMCDLYGSSFGEAIQTILPAGLIRQSRRKILATELAGEPTEASLQKLLQRIRKSKGLDFVSFARKEPKLLSTIRALEKMGYIKIDSVLGRSRAVEQKDRFYALAPHAPCPKASAQKRVWEILQTGEQPRIIFTEQNLGAALLALVKKGVVVETFKSKSYTSTSSFVSAPSVTLTHAQAHALTRIEAALTEKNNQKFLLFGVTGSGKTEVYLQAAAKALSEGRSVLALVPEIALTPQFVGRFRARFGDRISVLHSGRSESERLTEWKRIRRKEADIVIGPRGAVFAPLENVGLVIIDEEHDASYKQEDGLTYHVKHLAHFRADLDHAVVLMGSATPSMESYELAKQGKIELLTLMDRVGHFGLPNVEIVDLRHEFSKFGEKGLLSENLRTALEETLSKNEQAVLFLNRRGFAPLVLCPRCGESAECPNCSVSMTYHSEIQLLKCHYCDHVQKSSLPCSHCGQIELIKLGIGTEKLEQELQFHFPDAVIARMDRDTVEGKEGHEKILSAFASGKTDILLGTQMVTKGLDVENVTLVGVLLADQSLHFPDFRAAETTFQLLTQVAGRAGRGVKKGRAFFQTFLPDNYAVLAAKEQNYLSFYEQERVYREALQYPPFSSLSLIEISSSDENVSRTTGMWLRKQAEKVMAQKPELSLSLIGPAPCPIKKIQNRYRYHMIVRSPRGGASAKFAKWLTQTAKTTLAPLDNKDITLHLNVDPYRFL